MTDPSISVLLLDDEEDICLLLSRYLQKKGMTVYTSTQPEQALEMLQELAIDVFVSDLAMPQMNGLDLAKEIKKQRSQLEIILLTGYGSLETALEALRSRNIYDYLLKPLDELQNIELVIRRAAEYRWLKAENKTLTDELKKKNTELSHKVFEQNQALQKAYEDLQQTEALKSQFLANISHELRTPMTPLRGYLELFLEGELGSFDEESQDALKDMQTCVERLQKQIEQLLCLTLADKQELFLNFHPTPFHSWLRMLTFPSRVQFNFTAIQDHVQIDLDYLEKVIHILVDNACKFSDEETPIEIKTFNLTQTELKQWLQTPLLPFEQRYSYLAAIESHALFLQCQIRDQGIGILVDKLPLVGNAFYQIDGGITRSTTGMGLGLANAKKILAAHASLLSIESQEAKGTTVALILPVQ